MNPPLIEQPPTGVSAPSLKGSRRDPIRDGPDQQYVTGLHWEVIGDLRWAYEQEAAGDFVPYVGKYLAIVNRAIQAVGADPGHIIAEAARKTGVPSGRVALFHVELID